MPEPRPWSVEIWTTEGSTFWITCTNSAWSPPSVSGPGETAVMGGGGVPEAGEALGAEGLVRAVGIVTVQAAASSGSARRPRRRIKPMVWRW